MFNFKGNLVGSRLEYDSLPIKSKGDESEMSIDVKTTSADGVIFYAHQHDGSDFMAVYLKEGRVIQINITKYKDQLNNNINYF